VDARRPESTWGDGDETDTIHSRSGSADTIERLSSSQRPAPFEDPADINRLFAVRFAASPEFIAKLEQARALLSNRSAKARLVEVLDAALEAFLDRHAPDRRMARREARHRVREARKRRELSPSSMDPIQSSRDRSYHGVVARQRRIPAAARDAVFVRDEGRCTFVGSDGQTCGATHHLHIDHVVPYGVGGAHAIENLRVLCSIHNQLEAARVFGPRRSAGSSDG
jgi:5-methylcytosine-specific restriction endonuclease McrA